MISGTSPVTTSSAMVLPVMGLSIMQKLAEGIGPGTVSENEMIASDGFPLSSANGGNFVAGMLNAENLLVAMKLCSAVRSGLGKGGREERCLDLSFLWCIDGCRSVR